MMTQHRKPITREQYERAIANNRIIPDADRSEIFDSAELYGYGVYCPTAIEEDGAFLFGMLAGSCITSFLIAVITDIREKIIDRRWKRLMEEDDDECK